VTDATTPATPPEHHAPLAWLVPMCTAAAGIAFSAAYVPARVKLLVLFLVGIGAMIGLVSGYLARAYCHLRPGWVLGTTFFVTAVALVGSTLESHRLWANEVREAMRGELRAQRRAGDRLATPAALAAENDTIEHATSFGAYLVRRTSQLGAWPTMAAIAFLVVEILLGAALGTWITHRVAFPTPPV
jgi:hypothetical protein